MSYPRDFFPQGMGNMYPNYPSNYYPMSYMYDTTNAYPAMDPSTAYAYMNAAAMASYPMQAPYPMQQQLHASGIENAIDRSYTNAWHDQSYVGMLPQDSMESYYPNTVRPDATNPNLSVGSPGLIFHERNKWSQAITNPLLSPLRESQGPSQALSQNPPQNPPQALTASPDKSTRPAPTITKSSSGPNHTNDEQYPSPPRSKSPRPPRPFPSESAHADGFESGRAKSPSVASPESLHSSLQPQQLPFQGTSTLTSSNIIHNTNSRLQPKSAIHSEPFELPGSEATQVLRALYKTPEKARHGYLLPPAPGTVRSPVEKLSEEAIPVANTALVAAVHAVLADAASRAKQHSTTTIVPPAPVPMAAVPPPVAVLPIVAPPNTYSPSRSPSLQRPSPGSPPYLPGLANPLGPSLGVPISRPTRSLSPLARSVSPARSTLPSRPLDRLPHAGGNYNGPRSSSTAELVALDALSLPRRSASSDRQTGDAARRLATGTEDALPFSPAPVLVPLSSALLSHAAFPSLSSSSLSVSSSAAPVLASSTASANAAWSMASRTSTVGAVGDAAHRVRSKSRGKASLSQHDTDALFSLPRLNELPAVPVPSAEERALSPAHGKRKPVAKEAPLKHEEYSKKLLPRSQLAFVLQRETVATQQVKSKTTSNLGSTTGPTTTATSGPSLSTVTLSNPSLTVSSSSLSSTTNANAATTHSSTTASSALALPPPQDFASPSKPATAPASKGPAPAPTLTHTDLTSMPPAATASGQQMPRVPLTKPRATSPNRPPTLSSTLSSTASSGGNGPKMAPTASAASTVPHPTSPQLSTPPQPVPRALKRTVASLLPTAVEPPNMVLTVTEITPPGTPSTPPRESPFTLPLLQMYEPVDNVTDPSIHTTPQGAPILTASMLSTGFSSAPGAAGAVRMSEPTENRATRGHDAASTVSLQDPAPSGTLESRAGPPFSSATAVPVRKNLPLAAPTLAQPLPAGTPSSPFDGPLSEVTAESLSPVAPLRSFQPTQQGMLPLMSLESREVGGSFLVPPLRRDKAHALTQPVEEVSQGEVKFAQDESVTDSGQDTFSALYIAPLKPVAERTPTLRSPASRTPSSTLYSEMVESLPSGAAFRLTAYTPPAPMRRDSSLSATSALSLKDGRTDAVGHIEAEEEQVSPSELTISHPGSRRGSNVYTAEVALIMKGPAAVDAKPAKSLERISQPLLDSKEIWDMHLKDASADSHIPQPSVESGIAVDAGLLHETETISQLASKQNSAHAPHSQLGAEAQTVQKTPEDSNNDAPAKTKTKKDGDKRKDSDAILLKAEKKAEAALSALLTTALADLSALAFDSDELLALGGTEVQAGNDTTPAETPVETPSASNQSADTVYDVSSLSAVVGAAASKQATGSRISSVVPDTVALAEETPVIDGSANVSVAGQESGSETTVKNVNSNTKAVVPNAPQSKTAAAPTRAVPQAVEISPSMYDSDNTFSDEDEDAHEDDLDDTGGNYSAALLTPHEDEAETVSAPAYSVNRSHSEKASNISAGLANAAYTTNSSASVREKFGSATLPILAEPTQPLASQTTEAADPVAKPATILVTSSAKEETQGKAAMDSEESEEEEDSEEEVVIDLAALEALTLQILTGAQVDEKKDNLPPVTVYSKKETTIPAPAL